jgi:hypothetical protein
LRLDVCRASPFDCWAFSELFFDGGGWGYGRKVWLAVVDFHHADRPLLQINWGTLGGLQKGVMVLW